MKKIIFGLFCLLLVACSSEGPTNELPERQRSVFVKNTDYESDASAYMGVSEYGFEEKDLVIVGRSVVRKVTIPEGEESIMQSFTAKSEAGPSSSGTCKVSRSEPTVVVWDGVSIACEH